MAADALPMDFLLSEEFARDPYARYAKLRAEGPVHRIDFPPGAEAFLIVDHEHGHAALNDPRLSKDTAHSSVPVDPAPYFGGTMLGMDPPDHTRLRGLVAKRSPRDGWRRCAPASSSSPTISWTACPAPSTCWSRSPSRCRSRSSANCSASRRRTAPTSVPGRP
ncbi:cytochrome P450 [Actinomadura sp. CNU-125]|uniref:cytochrome P450 n=1 Tax=Actinomadura sp. CNU-125 TaxID=1904961 RepID=UPI0021CCA413|nr:cytochrome P450 [Actinomadura sp. CNU-125]